MTTPESKALAERVKDQAQIYASAWSLVGGRFYFGDSVLKAQEEKACLKAMIDQLASLAASTPSVEPAGGVPTDEALLALVPWEIDTSDAIEEAIDRQQTLKFARSVLALAAAPKAQEALTEEQISKAVGPLYASDEAARMGLADDVATTRAIERAHGIATSEGAPE